MTGVDEGEVFDLVCRKGPISRREITDQVGAYSPDEVFRALRSLHEEGKIRSRPGSVEEDGTTRELYYADGDDGRTENE